MRKLKRFFVFATACLMSMSIAGCGGESTTPPATSETITPKTEMTDTTETKAVKIGVLQLVEHQALDSSYQGFKMALKDNGYIEGENLTIDFQNAQGDQSNLKAMSQRFVSNEVDLILAIATQSAQSVAAETPTIPILVTAVTDLVDAKLVETNEKPGGNVTGTSDIGPINEQIDLLKKLVPDAKTIGIIYNSSEANSLLQANIAIEKIKAIGCEFVEKTVTSSNDVQQVTQSLVGKVDAIYIPTDNTLASSMPIIGEIAISNKIPVICGEPNMVKAGGLATIGIDYTNLGYQTGEMAVKILKGEATPADMPVESSKETQCLINKELATKIGITIPEDLQQYVN